VRVEVGVLRVEEEGSPMLEGEDSSEEVLPVR
jgi:hypothetical protein